MIPASGSIKLAAVLFAGAVHLAVGAVLMGSDDIELEGGGGGTEVALGTAFEDLVEGGALVAETPVAAVEDRGLQASETPVDGPALAKVAALAALKPVRPTPADRAKSVAGAQPSMAVAAAAASERMTLDPVTPEEPSEGRRAEGSAPRSPAAAEPLAAVAARQTLSAAPSPRPAPGQSGPPPPRPGNASQSGAVGAPEGRESGLAARSPAPETPEPGGSAAASNYPGKIMRCISRASRMSRSGGGTAVIRFAVDGTGRIGGVAVAASSGDPRLDRAAARAIGGAGPCPPPPRGAKTTFVVRVR